MIARQLRDRQLDVVAIAEDEQAGRYAGIADDVVFERAQEDLCTLVTDNMADFEHVRRDWEARGVSYHGVVYALDPPFNRHQGEAVIGQMVLALASFLASSETQSNMSNRVHFLRPAGVEPSDS